MIIWEKPSIFICDDEPLYCEEIRSICESTLRDMEISEAIINEGHDGKSVFEYEGKIDILILDIDMPEMDGIRVKDNVMRICGVGLSEIELKISVRKKKEVLERWKQYKRKRMGYA